MSLEKLSMYEVFLKNATKITAISSIYIGSFLMSAGLREATMQSKLSEVRDNLELQLPKPINSVVDFLDRTTSAEKYYIGTYLLLSGTLLFIRRNDKPRP